jgi:hypothetical protein
MVQWVIRLKSDTQESFLPKLNAVECRESLTPGTDYGTVVAGKFIRIGPGRDHKAEWLARKDKRNEQRRLDRATNRAYNELVKVFREIGIKN